MKENNKNSDFIVTARKWRPKKFSEVVGQEHITTTLKNAILSGRVHHAYLFSGPRGVGKTTTARIYARAVNYPESIEQSPEEMNEDCKNILEGRSMDVIEIDGASNNSVEDIRSLRENSKYPPTKARYKIYIIDEVHMLSTSAFNALLKTLEEPPAHLLFVFATTEIHKVPATIISRCQRFDFKRMSTADIVKQLQMICEQEDINVDEQSLITIAKKADGSMRDAQSVFDQVIAFCGKDVKYSEMANALHLIDEDIYFEITGAMLENSHSKMFSITSGLVGEGYDLQETLEGMIEHFRNISVIKATGNYDLVDAADTYIQKYEDAAKNFTQNDLVKLMTVMNDAQKDMKFSSQPRIRFELALNQLASFTSSVDITELINKIEELKKKPELKQESRVINDRQEDYKAVKKNYEPKQPKAEKPTKPASDPMMDKWQKLLKTDEAEEYKAFITELTPEFGKNRIKLFADNKFIYDMVMQSETNLINTIKNHYSDDIEIHIKLETENEELKKKKMEIKDNINTYSKEGSSKSVNPAQSVDVSKLHPVEKALVEEFNAEKIS